MEKDNTGDIGLKQDYLSAIKDIIAIELHLQRTAAKTNNIKYLEILSEIRKSRAKHLWSIIGKKAPEGEVWCILKHSMLVSKQLTEAGDKYLDKGDLNCALEFYKEAMDYDGIFHLLLEIGWKNGLDGQSKAKA